MDVAKETTIQMKCKYVKKSVLQRDNNSNEG